MTTTIALAGKGGVGKTTTAGMVIKYLIQNQPGAVLAIDADTSSNLNMVLGLDLEWTVGEIRAAAGDLADVVYKRCDRAVDVRQAAACAQAAQARLLPRRRA